MDSVSEPLLSVILPTYNERENIVLLVPRILDVLWDVPCEVIVVDDSSADGTADAVREMAASDARVRLVERPGKAGLASAVFAGTQEARGQFAAIMDADLSHDPEELPDMLARAMDGYDVVIGSRYVKGAMFVGQPMTRRMLSVVLNVGARGLLMLPHNDVLTGFCGVPARSGDSDADALLLRRVQVASGAAGDAARVARLRVAYRVPRPEGGNVEGERERGGGAGYAVHAPDLAARRPTHGVSARSAGAALRRYVL